MPKIENENKVKEAQAKAVLEKAKIEVERMILGE